MLEAYGKVPNIRSWKNTGNTTETNSPGGASNAVLFSGSQSIITLRQLEWCIKTFRESGLHLEKEASSQCCCRSCHGEQLNSKVPIIQLKGPNRTACAGDSEMSWDCLQGVFGAALHVHILQGWSENVTSQQTHFIHQLLYPHQMLFSLNQTSTDQLITHLPPEITTYLHPCPPKTGA